MLLRSLLTLLCLLSAASFVRAESPASRPVSLSADGKPLITIQQGNLPLILSAPHGGRLAIPGAAKRTGENFLIKRGLKNNFTDAFDGNVDLVALTLADEIEKRTGKRPYVVVANFSRTYVDANRTAEEAYESDAAKAVYEEYHGAIRKFRTEIIQKWKRGLLIDIHGHGRDAEAIIRGTADWHSVRHLVEEFGKEAVAGPEGLLGPIAAAGNKFIPPIDKFDEKEYTALNGGFITRNYGSFQGGNFDAIQFELGTNYRKAENIPKFATQLADGIVPFMKKYLLIGATTTRPSTVPAVEK
jgi:N-formylglutamate amidohydrolase